MPDFFSFFFFASSAETVNLSLALSFPSRLYQKSTWRSEKISCYLPQISAFGGGGEKYHLLPNRKDDGIKEKNNNSKEWRKHKTGKNTSTSGMGKLRPTGRMRPANTYGNFFYVCNLV